MLIISMLKMLNTPYYSSHCSSLQKPSYSLAVNDYLDISSLDLGHSTETELTKFLNNIKLYLDSGKNLLTCLLDVLSAAFIMVDNNT